MKQQDPPCAACGMHTLKPNEYHPYAACLMFKACHDAETVRTNLAAVIEHAIANRGKKR